MSGGEMFAPLLTIAALCPMVSTPLRALAGFAIISRP